MKKKLNKILTLHPDGKAGVNIDKSKYDIIKNYIIEKLTKTDSLEFSHLSQMAVAQLGDTFEGKVIWYMVTVKLDLEARGLLERIPGKKPQQLRLKRAR